MTQRDDPKAALTCPVCGKLSYPSRRTAKRAAKVHGNNRRAYQCGDYWHLASYQPWQSVAWHRGRAT